VAAAVAAGAMTTNDVRGIAGGMGFAVNGEPMHVGAEPDWGNPAPFARTEVNGGNVIVEAWPGGAGDWVQSVIFPGNVTVWRAGAGGDSIGAEFAWPVRPHGAAEVIATEEYVGERLNAIRYPLLHVAGGLMTVGMYVNGALVHRQYYNMAVRPVPGRRFRVNIPVHVGPNASVVSVRVGMAPRTDYAPSVFTDTVVINGLSSFPATVIEGEFVWDPANHLVVVDVVAASGPSGAETRVYVGEAWVSLSE
jgi:hypothetical protein